MPRRKKAGTITAAEVTIGPDHVPRSSCQKCRRDGRISSCERVGRHEDYVFVCECGHRWTITL